MQALSQRELNKFCLLTIPSDVENIVFPTELHGYKKSEVDIVIRRLHREILYYRRMIDKINLNKKVKINFENKYTPAEIRKIKIAKSKKNGINIKLVNSCMSKLASDVSYYRRIINRSLK